MLTSIQCVFLDFGVARGLGLLFMVCDVPLVTRFYAVIKNYVKNVDSTVVCVCSFFHGVTWFFMPKYGHCDVTLVT